MRLMSSILAIPKLLLAFCLIGSVTVGYGLLASYSLVFLHCGHSLLLKSIIMTAILSAGLYFSFQTAGTLFNTDCEPLSEKGSELYSQQRASTLWVTGSLGWALLLSLYPLDTFYICIISALLGFAQLQLAQSLSSGRAFHLIVCQNEAKRAANFSILKFIDEKILSYASKKYLNTQISAAIFLALIPLETLSEAAYSQGLSAIASHFILTWATAAQWIIALGFILPCVYYIWSNSTFFVKLRQLTNWLAPSFLSVIQLCAIFALSIKVIHQGTEAISFIDLESIGLNVLAATLPFALSPISQKLTESHTEQEEEITLGELSIPADTTPFNVNLEDRTELLF